MADEAQKEKQLGNDAYKKRDFETAIAHYEKAWELHKDITFLTNLAAVYFEQERYPECVETCQKAVDEGRDMRADYKLIAKAFARMGSAYSKQNDYENAIKFFNKSLTEHRTPDALAKLKEAEKLKAEADRLAYVNPELADKAREEGNVLFKAGDFAGSVKLYTESIKRNPEDPKGYTNRASMDPTFVKGYIRKANVLLAMKDFDKALQILEKASEVDVEKKNSTEIGQVTRKVMEAMYTTRSTETEEQTLERAMRDPEVRNIMTDPIMQDILQQSQRDPAALQAHLKNPMIREKIQKLAAAGIIRTR
ncbi:TPR-like protein [Atractiella rhizophila]|nr:TPR-like protein [Atractiella rhizophila]